MDRCCICGKELEIMDSYQLFSTKRLYICDDCFDMKSKLISVNPMERLRAKEYMTILLEEGLVDERVQKEIWESIEKADRNLQENLYDWQQDQERETEKQKNLADYLEKRKGFTVTTGPSFDGYRVKRYIDVVSGEEIMGMGLFGDISANVTNVLGTSNATFGERLSRAKKEAQKRMIKEAIACGANAVLAMDFDMMVLTNHLVVSANGTAVEIEAIE